MMAGMFVPHMNVAMADQWQARIKNVYGQRDIEDVSTDDGSDQDGVDASWEAEVAAVAACLSSFRGQALPREAIKVVNTFVEVDDQTGSARRRETSCPPDICREAPLVMVRNIPSRLRADGLKEHLKALNVDVLDVHVPLRRLEAQKVNRGYGFVMCRDAAAAQRCVDAVSGTQLVNSRSSKRLVAIFASRRVRIPDGPAPRVQL